MLSVVSSGMGVRLGVGLTEGVVVGDGRGVCVGIGVGVAVTGIEGGGVAVTTTRTGVNGKETGATGVELLWQPANRLSAGMAINQK